MEKTGTMNQLARHVAVWFYADGQVFKSGSFASNTLGFPEAEFAAEYRRSVAAKTREVLRRKTMKGHWHTVSRNQPIAGKKAPLRVWLRVNHPNSRTRDSGKETL